MKEDTQEKKYFESPHRIEQTDALALDRIELKSFSIEKKTFVPEGKPVTVSEPEKKY